MKGKPDGECGPTNLFDTISSIYNQYKPYYFYVKVRSDSWDKIPISINIIDNSDVSSKSSNSDAQQQQQSISSGSDSSSRSAVSLQQSTNSPSSHTTIGDRQAQTGKTQYPISEPDQYQTDQQLQNDPLVGTWVYDQTKGGLNGPDTIIFNNDGTGKSILNGNQIITFTWKPKTQSEGYGYTLLDDSKSEKFTQDIRIDGQGSRFEHIWVIGWCVYVRGNQISQVQSDQKSGSSSNANIIGGSDSRTTSSNRNVNGNFVKVSMNNIANAPIDHVSSLNGDVNFGGVPFYINREFTTQDQGYPNRPTQSTLTVNIPSPQRVYIILNGAYVSQSFEGNQVGNINFEFNDGSDFTYPIIAGTNLRETWSASGTITSVRDSSFYNVFTQSQTRGHQSAYGYMDRYTIEIPNTYQSKTMTGIQIIDTSNSNVRSYNPGLVLQGITVEQI